MSTAVKQIPIHDFVAQLRKFRQSAFDQTEEIRRYLQETPVSSDSLAPYLTWDRQHYTRNLIDKTPLYELLAICWEVGQASSVHNHRDQNCWMAVPMGKLRVQNFRVSDRDALKGKCSIVAADFYDMDPEHPAAVSPDAPVHQVLNLPAFGQRAVSIHIYSRPYDSCEVYVPERGTYRDVPLHYTSEYGKLSPDEKLV